MKDECSMLYTHIHLHIIYLHVLSPIPFHLPHCIHTREKNEMDTHIYKGEDVMLAKYNVSQGWSLSDAVLVYAVLVRYNVSQI